MAGKKNTPKKRVTRKHSTSERHKGWSDSQYWAFIRSGLRAKWTRYPPKWEVLRQAQRPAVGRSKQTKWEYLCAACGIYHLAKDVSVDHIVACGTLKSYDDLPLFVSRLFCKAEELQVLCTDCHKEKTHAERQIQSHV